MLRLGSDTKDVIKQPGPGLELRLGQQEPAELGSSIVSAERQSGRK